MEILCIASKADVQQCFIHFHLDYKFTTDNPNILVNMKFTYGVI